MFYVLSFELGGYARTEGVVGSRGIKRETSDSTI